MFPIEVEDALSMIQACRSPMIEDQDCGKNSQFFSNAYAMLEDLSYIAQSLAINVRLIVDTQ